MARPIKEGLEYFPLDVDIDQDDKIALIEAQHGLIGFGITIKLLMKIYDNSYFYKWTEKEQLLFSKRVNVDINLVNVVINDLVKWNFFNKNIFDTYKVLTSKGIQQRYLDATGRRQKVKIQAEYLLLDQETVNAYKNLVIVDNNPSSKGVNVDISTQSKEKKSKVKESKENNNKEKDLLLLLWEQLGFGTINSGSNFICIPSPVQSGQAPAGLLKENNLGSIFSILIPHFWHAKFSLKLNSP